MAYLFDRTLSSQLGWSHVTNLSGMRRLSIHAWIYAVSAAGSLFAQTTGGNTNGFALYHQGTDATSVLFGVFDAVTVGYNAKAGILQVGMWNAVHFVYDGTEAGVARGRVWVNGLEITSWDTSVTMPTSVGTSTGIFRVGTEEGTLNFWSGRIAEVAIWPNLALTNPQIIRAMAAGLSARNAHPVGLAHYMPLSRASGTVDVLTGRDASASSTVTLVEHPFTQQPFRRRLTSRLITSLPSVAWLPVSRVAQGPVTRFAPGGMVPPG
jgi:hypothetical protein